MSAGRVSDGHHSLREGWCVSDGIYVYTICDLSGAAETL